MFFSYYFSIILYFILLDIYLNYVYFEGGVRKCLVKTVCGTDIVNRNFGPFKVHYSGV